MTQEEKEKRREQISKDLLFYLNNYHELTATRPAFKKVIDKEIQEIINELKALSR